MRQRSILATIFTVIIPRPVHGNSFCLARFHSVMVILPTVSPGMEHDVYEIGSTLIVLLHVFCWKYWDLFIHVKINLRVGDLQDLLYIFFHICVQLFHYSTVPVFFFLRIHWRLYSELVRMFVDLHLWLVLSSHTPQCLC